MWEQNTHNSSKEIYCRKKRNRAIDGWGIRAKRMFWLGWGGAGNLFFKVRDTTACLHADRNLTDGES